MARQERAIRTRRAILVAAAQVFDEVGYEAATISDVLKKSGMTKGALYFHFTSKEELAQAVLAGQVDSLPRVPEQGLKLQQSLDEALLLAYLLKQDTGDPIVQGSVRLTVDQGSPKDHLNRRVPMQAWQEHTHALFREAKARGEVLPHADVDALAKLFVGAFTGVQVLSRIMTGRADLAERVADLYRHLMPSIAVPGILVRLDFSPERATRVHADAMRLREAEADAESEAESEAEAEGDAEGEGEADSESVSESESESGAESEVGVGLGPGSEVAEGAADGGPKASRAGWPVAAVTAGQ
ncbi:ScbR family autoregulator-binding transcription factor [Streptomyces sp. NPDC102365]|uniref:ScbR family autoregulator-binding transcription factor n=1 Tax=Streptomyces sp. NPDC102365 TaxID=3366162 RepID=UPI003813421A